MDTQLRSWWQKNIKLVIIGFIALLAVIVLIYVGHQFSWTGFQNKTLWDWFQLLGVLAIPVAVGFGTVWFTQAQQQRDQELADQRAQANHDAAERRAQTEHDVALDNQREAALQAYIDSMSELLLHEKLRDSEVEDEVRKIAHVRTLTILPRLDSKRKRNLLLFLYDAGLIARKHQIINVRDADFSEADLSEVNLCQNRQIRDSLNKGEGIEIAQVEADLSGVNLRKANLNGAHLSRVKLGAMFSLDLDISRMEGRNMANLSKATLIKADLRNAVLGGVNLSGADLSEAILSGANLQCANLSLANLHGADLGIQPFVEDLGGPAEDMPDISGWVGADLSEANLRGANLSEADLWQADLHGADLHGANLSGANLTGAKVTDEQLAKAYSLQGATMPDGTKHA